MPPVPLSAEKNSANKITTPQLVTLSMNPKPNKLLIVGMTLLVAGAVFPLLGSLGIVLELVHSFDVVASSSTAPDPSNLVRGLSMSLWAVVVGIVLGVLSALAGLTLVMITVAFRRHNQDKDG
jgi:biopolymer transport protein ExbB/TolQ